MNKRVVIIVYILLVIALSVTTPLHNSTPQVYNVDGTQTTLTPILNQTINITGGTILAPHLYDWDNLTTNGNYVSYDFGLNSTITQFFRETNMMTVESEGEVETINYSDTITWPKWFYIKTNYDFNVWYDILVTDTYQSIGGGYLSHYDQDGNGFSVDLGTSVGSSNLYVGDSVYSKIKTSINYTRGEDIINKFDFIYTSKNDNKTAFGTYNDTGNYNPFNYPDSNPLNRNERDDVVQISPQVSSGFYWKAKIKYLALYRDYDTRQNTVYIISNPVVLVDPTFYDGSNYIELITGVTGSSSGSVQRVKADNVWLWVLENATNDSLVHLEWFPAGSVVRFVDNATGSVVKEVYIDNPSRDYAVSIPDGVYNVEVDVVSTYRFINSYAYTEPSNPNLGDNVIVHSEFIDVTSGVITGLNVSATVTRPDNRTSSIVLRDDGVYPDDIAGDGVYSGLYNQTNITGKYRVDVYTIIEGENVSSVSYFDVGLNGFYFKSIHGSMTSVALVDGLLSFSLTIVGLVGLLYWYKRHRLFNLLVLGVIVLSFGLVLLGIRSSIVDYISNDNGVITPHYTYNPYSRFYLAPIYTGILVLGIYVIAWIRYTTRRAFRI